MTMFVMVLLLMTAAWIGYQVGRRAAVRTPTWRQRTRRTALARQALELVTLMAASQLQHKVQRRMPARRPPPYAEHLARMWR